MSRKIISVTNDFFMHLGYIYNVLKIAVNVLHLEMCTV